MLYLDLLKSNRKCWGGTQKLRRQLCGKSRTAAEAGRISGGNFKNNPARAPEAGRKGGQISRRGAP
ncbi:MULTISPECIES: general stress protein [Actinomycetes]|uniref:general stress protein n=1 Tax=Actinomycetes TaxID=1760 RepID=UPI0036442B1F